MEVVPKKNISELVDAVEKLTDINNIYILAVDNAYDNRYVSDLLERLDNNIYGRNNIIKLDIYCFEYILLTFTKLYSWLIKQINLENKGIEMNAWRGLLTMLSEDDELTATEMLQVVKDYKEKYGTKRVYSVESFCSSLIKNLTAHSGFSVTKGELGGCWKVDCCNTKSFSHCDISLTDYEKIIMIYDNSCLPDVLLEVRERLGI